MIVISPKVEERDRIIRQLQLSLDEIPIYLDNGSSFLMLNPFIPKDNRFHCFLTDAKGRVVFVGDPTWGVRTETLFREKLRKIQ